MRRIEAALFTLRLPGEFDEPVTETLDIPKEKSNKQTKYMEERLIKVGITHGDINGIGYEVILKTFSDTRMAELCTPIIYGSSKIAAYHRKALSFLLSI